MSEPKIQAGDALLVVDVQNDFCPGGALPVEEGHRVVPVLNCWMAAARERGALVVASRDWHPPGHVSFNEQGGPWPEHCVHDTEGAEFHPDLQLPAAAHVVHKGTDVEKDAYSALDGTNVLETLREKGVRRVWVGGLAQDVCVRATVLDACAAGFEVHVLLAATRPVDPEEGRRAIDEMRAAGAIIEEGDHGP